jgi:ATP-dependent Clp protease protease subunit
LYALMSEHTGRTVEEIARDSERDNFLTAKEALDYGLIDQVLDRRA